MQTGLEQYGLERAGYYIRREAFDARTRGELLPDGNFGNPVEPMADMMPPRVREALETIGGFRADDTLAATVDRRDATSWSRRCGTLSFASPAEEAAALARQAETVETRVALTDDESLLVLPGTHVAPLSREDRAAVESDPSGSAPGQVRIRLRAGDALVWNPNVAHRTDGRGKGATVTIRSVNGRKQE